jgi:hypothetical protein
LEVELRFKNKSLSLFLSLSVSFLLSLPLFLSLNLSTHQLKLFHIFRSKEKEKAFNNLEVELRFKKESLDSNNKMWSDLLTSQAKQV